MLGQLVALAVDLCEDGRVLINWRRIAFNGARQPTGPNLTGDTNLAWRGVARELWGDGLRS